MDSTILMEELNYAIYEKVETKEITTTGWNY